MIDQEQEQQQQQRRQHDGEEDDECNGGGGKHVWMYSSFCDQCNADFDDWMNEIPRKVAFDLVVEDLNKVLDEMWKERRINRNNSIELYNRMKKRAEDRGYIK